MTSAKPQSIAWITGASSGIGRALALKLATENWLVAASARTKSKLDALAQGAEGLPGAIHPFALDITDNSNVEHVLELIEQQCGPIDLAVLNAGSHVADTAATMSGERVTRLMALNVTGTVDCLHGALRKMRERGRGHIAIVSSLAGYMGLPGATAYGASKAALISIAESLRPELDRAGIKLQLVNPGFVKTPLTDKNDFEMPFLMDVDVAVDALYRGLMGNRFEITFPTRFAWLMKLLRLLPYGLYFSITRRLLRK